jgi:hypothetical protein
MTTITIRGSGPCFRLVQSLTGARQVLRFAAARCGLLNENEPERLPINRSGSMRFIGALADVTAPIHLNLLREAWN